MVEPRWALIVVYGGTDRRARFRGVSVVHLFSSEKAALAARLWWLKQRHVLKADVGPISKVKGD